MCKEWGGATTPDGYPRRLYKGNANTRWHRVVCAEANGLTLDDIKGRVVRHTCDNPLCVDPDHLVLGDVKDNVDDRTKRDRAQGMDMLTARELVELYREGVSYKELAAAYGVSRSTVYYTIKRVNHAGG